MNHLSATATFVVLGVALLVCQSTQQGQGQGQPNGTAANGTAASPAANKSKGVSATPSKSASDVAPVPPPLPSSLSPAPPAYTPTHDQSQSLTIDSLDAQLAQHTYAEEAQKLPSFAQFQQKVGKLQSDCAKVIADNHWPDGVQCDMSRVPVVFCVRLPCLGDAPAGASVVAPAVTPKP